jgi:hypothetical protein
MVARLGAVATLVALVFGAQTATAARPAVSLALLPGQLASGEIRFVASTGANADIGGRYLELRGIDLAARPSHTYARPDVIRAGCNESSCTFAIGRSAEARYEFRAFLLDSHTDAVVSRSKPIRRSWPSLPVDGVQLLVNGKVRPLTEMFHVTDDYVPIAPGALDVVAHWKRRPRTPGYSVRISTTEPVKREYARCTTGTTCRVRKTLSIRRDQELSLLVSFHRPDGSLIDGFQYCLVGRA